MAAELLGAAEEELDSRSRQAHNTTSNAHVVTLGQGNEWFPRFLGSDPVVARRLLGSGLLGIGPPLQMVEMIGTPGDVTLWDPRVIHSSSGNVSDRPRSVIRFRLDQSNY